jgi:hypothetical protein
MACMYPTTSRTERMKLLRLAASFAAVLSLAQLAPSTATAQTVGDASELEVEARARFQLGQLYYSQARFAQAAAEFEAAYATHPHPLLLHNIYLARRDLGDIPGAVDALRRYLASATDLSASDRRLLEGRLATMERQLPATTTTTTAPSDPVVTTTSDETSELSSPAPTELVDPPEEHAQEPVPAPSGGMGIVPGAVVVGLGGAGLIGAAIAGGVAMGVQSERDGMCTLPNGDCPASVNQADYASRFSGARDAAWGLFAVGAATAVVGAVLLGVGASEPSSDTPSVSAACDGSGCLATVSGHF